MNHPKLPIGPLLGLLPWLLFATAAAQPAPTGDAMTLRGRIVDAQSMEPVYAAEVVLVGAGHWSLTDQDGRFAFRNLPLGTYSLRVTRMGYEVLLRENIQLEAGAAQDLNLRLTPKPIQLAQITVTPGAFTFMETGGTVRQTMSREDLESVTQVHEDVFRAVNRLPGLSSGDYSAHFSIRGGRHDETLILLDELELYEPYHLKDYNEGAISIVDMDAVEGIELLTGGFPARYGNKRSGVFKIASRRPRSERAMYSVGLSLVNARAMAMGRLGKGTGSWLVSARSGYLDLVFNLINQNDLPSPRYHDTFAKLEADLNPNHKFSLEALHAGDKYTFDAKATTGFGDTINTRERARNHYGNSYGWATLQSNLGPRTLVRNMVSAGLVTRDRDGAEEYIGGVDPLYSVTNKRDFSILGFKQDWTLPFLDTYVLGAGVDLRRLRSTDVVNTVVGQDPNDPATDTTSYYPVRTSSSFNKTGTLAALYFSNRWRAVAPFVLEVGGRYDRASHTGDRDFSPRVSAALSLSEATTLRAGWGYYRQIQGIDDVGVLDASRRYYPSELSKQWTVGLERLSPRNGVLRLEGYFKKGSGLRPAYRNWKGGLDVFQESNEDRILVFPRSSTSKGMEIYSDRRLGERSRLRASYALSFADEVVDRIDNVNSPDPAQFDRQHPSPQDQRHALNVDYTFHLTPTWIINALFTIHSGWPGTVERFISVTDSTGATNLAVRPEKIYGVRLPHYQRLDVRATRRWSTSRGDLRFFAEVVNLTNHSNIFAYDYIKSVTAGGDFFLARESLKWFTILPSIGVSWNSPL